MIQQELVARAKSGDSDAFAQLVEDNQDRVYSLALRMVNTPEDAADLAQEAFLTAWRKLDTFQGEAAFSTWLYRLTANLCIDFLRKEKRRRAAAPLLYLDDTGEEASMDLPDLSADPQQHLEQQEVRAQIVRAMADLTADHRQILSLREIAGLSYAEIARLLNTEEGTVKSRISRARAALRKKLLTRGNFFSDPSSEFDESRF